MKLTLIVATDKNFGIGINGDMLFYIGDDLKRFKELTMDNIVIMGRRTFEALPNSKELPNRTNIVLSRNKLDLKEGISVSSIDELEDKLGEINPNKEKEEFLIGGGNLVNTLWNYIDKALITIVNKGYEEVDTHIPNLFNDENFEVVSESEEFFDDKNQLKYKFYEFKRRV
ncbi:dihydrofolate reductase [Miniphocaeibacter halophilus]|uniref:Dihydrofolate reductase n=1 Tax=Miniphocaeibacter halophilus TaxID=2931922 RepID=A0AC61MST1_9FIRM|nr:dihydrofolate reductase [Miniphocaeibacter halophilus]QQK08552.1 dihydrofolate reductase [Miniphocaeibacter halophilus]